MKKIISALLSVLMIMTVFSSAVFASGQTPGASPMYDNSDTIYSNLSFQGKTAKCQSVVIIAGGEQLVKITQTLEKQNYMGDWETVGGAWIKEGNTGIYLYSFNNTKNVTSSGKYRVKSVFVILNENGIKDSPIKYSTIVTI